jgi:hypothetical protein
LSAPYSLDAFGYDNIGSEVCVERFLLPREPCVSILCDSMAIEGDGKKARKDDIGRLRM